MTILSTRDREGLRALSSLVSETVASGVARRALLLRADLLPLSLSSPGHLRRAREAIETLRLADRGRCHDLPGGRLVVSWKGEAPKLLQDTIGAIDELLQENPFEAPGTNQLLAFFDLPKEGVALLKEATAAALRPEAPAPAPDAPPIFATPPVARPIDAAMLASIERGLASAELSRFARRKPISHYTTQGMQLAWEERTISVPELMNEVAPGRDAKSEPWLFRRLTRILDRRMLSILCDPKEVREARPFSITLNVASVLSPEFLRFDAALPPALRDRVVLGFLPADLAADASAFAFARNFARARNYKICLRAVTAKLLPALALPSLELDFVQLVWSAELGRLDRLPSAGAARWIMGQPCADDAIRWGTAAHIGLFATAPTL